MDFIDQNNTLINDGDALLFSHEDKLEPSGYSRYITNVRLCFWSENEKRYIPLIEQYKDGVVDESEVVINSVYGCRCGNIQP